MRIPKDLEATSLLKLGMTGAIGGDPFKLSGRRCVRGRRGSIWNEWSLHFDHRRPPLFLGESGGTFTLYSEGSILPPPEALFPGHPVEIPWIVVERGVATRLAKWGDLDEAPETYEYADLSFRGTPTRRASIAEGTCSIGVPMHHDALGLTIPRDPPLLVPAPDVSLPSGIELWLDVGDVGTLEGVAYRVLGIVSRSRPRLELDAPIVKWQEYLLYCAGVGLRWLVVADGNWCFVSPLEAGEVKVELELNSGAQLDWATGELPWAAEIGEMVMVAEQDDLALERSLEDISWSRTTDLAPDDVARAFKKRALPRPK